MSDTVEILRKARALVAEHWCQEDYATTAQGDWVEPRSSKAVNFCMIGACAHVANQRVREVEDGPIWRLLEEVCGEPPIEFNDAAKSNKPVLAAFDRAIAAAEKSDA